MLKRLAFIALLVLTTKSSTIGQPTTAPADEQVVTRVYDISDLLWTKSNYFAPADKAESTGGGMPGMTGSNGQPADHPASNPDLADQIQRLLMDTVDPQTWKD